MAGGTIQVVPAASTDPPWLPVLHQDADLVAIDKPAGLLVHPSALDAHARHTALALLQDQCGERLWPLHRLDKGTSGVLLFARHAAAARHWAMAFEAGTIHKRYVALVPPETVGLGLTAYLNVRLEKHTESHKRNPMDVFRASVQTWPEVVECASLTGEMDYLLRVVVADMAHYSRFIMDTLLKHPSVQDCKTSFVLDRVKATTAVPV